VIEEDNPDAAALAPRLVTHWWSTQPPAASAPTPAPVPIHVTSEDDLPLGVPVPLEPPKAPRAEPFWPVPLEPVGALPAAGGVGGDDEAEKPVVAPLPVESTPTPVESELPFDPLGPVETPTDAEVPWGGAPPDPEPDPPEPEPPEPDPPEPGEPPDPPGDEPAGIPREPRSPSGLTPPPGGADMVVLEAGLAVKIWGATHAAVPAVARSDSRPSACRLDTRGAVSPAVPPGDSIPPIPPASVIWSPTFR
jgi:hypothetical protein